MHAKATMKSAPAMAKMRKFVLVIFFSFHFTTNTSKLPGTPMTLNSANIIDVGVRTSWNSSIEESLLLLLLYISDGVTRLPLMICE